MVNEAIEKLLNEKVEQEDIAAAAISRVKQIDKLISEMRGIKFDWAEKAVNALLYHKRPLSTAEILDYAFILDKESLKNPIRRKRYVHELSRKLFYLCNRNILVKQENKGVRGNLYRLATIHP